MSLATAQDLLQIIMEQAPRKRPIIKQVGNGHEYVVMLNDGTYLWNMRDWYERYQVSEPIPAQEEEEQEA